MFVDITLVYMKFHKDALNKRQIHPDRAALSILPRLTRYSLPGIVWSLLISFLSILWAIYGDSLGIQPNGEVY